MQPTKKKTIDTLEKSSFYMLCALCAMLEYSFVQCSCHHSQLFIRCREEKKHAVFHVYTRICNFSLAIRQDTFAPFLRAASCQKITIGRVHPQENKYALVLLRCSARTNTHTCMDIVFLSHMCEGWDFSFRFGKILI